MFKTLTEKFRNLTLHFSGNKKLTDTNIADAIRDVRLALLDADVNYSIVSSFIKEIKEKSIGLEKIKNVDPGDQFIKIVHGELVSLMGGSESDINLRSGLTKIILCGLQGSGKTTSAAKIALYLKKKFNKKPLLVSLDLQRAAAVEQLRILAKQIGVGFFSLENPKSPLEIAKSALKEDGYDVHIFDTAGRLHIDDELMNELDALKNIINPHETYFVANSASGQDAVKVAKEFDRRLNITGSILTMLDGSSRAGAALSIGKATDKPLVFEGVGEKIDEFQLFNPTSMADRILGMGDVINFVKKAEEQFSDEESKMLEKKIMSATFTFDDYLKTVGGIKKMGSMKSLIKMMPGVGDSFDIDGFENSFNKSEAIIFSMTIRERQCLDEIIPSRKKRIAKGSGNSLEEVNRMLKGFKELKLAKKHMSKIKDQFKKNNSFFSK